MKDVVLPARAGAKRTPKIDDYINDGSRTAKELSSLERLGVTNGSFDDPLAPLRDLPTSPEIRDVEVRLRTVGAAVNGADPLHRAAIRASAIEYLKDLFVPTPSRLVDAALRGSKSDAPGQGRVMLLSDPEPWPDPVDGASLLGEIAATFAQFVALPAGAADALALLVVNAHAHDASTLSPLTILTSPAKRCGKTTTLEVVSALVPRPLFAVNITPAALFRVIERYRPTLLVDEADTFLAQSDELRGVLNAGHTRTTAMVVRTVGDDHEPRAFSTWCPKFIAAIGRLAETLEDRAVVIPLKRRAPGECIARLRRDRLGDLEPPRRRAARWAADHLDVLRHADPMVPPELHDRAADNWRSLLALADAASGGWPERARRAALTLSGAVVEGETAAALMLIADLRALFAKTEADRLTTATILTELCALDERPWGEWGRGKPLTPVALAKLLAPFGARPRTIRDGNETAKGYTLGDLADAFGRYLPSPEPSHPSQPNGDALLDDEPDPSRGPVVTAAKPSTSSGEERLVTAVTASALRGEEWGEE